jgi:CO dehydrogenase/acetyl-CoA synthase alpha subunit
MGTERQERCDDCDRDTPHDVRIELRAESESPGENAAFSREPYRVTTCRRCETSRARRMNDA